MQHSSKLAANRTSLCIRKWPFKSSFHRWKQLFHSIVAQVDQSTRRAKSPWLRARSRQLECSPCEDFLAARSEVSKQKQCSYSESLDAASPHVAAEVINWGRKQYTAEAIASAVLSCREHLAESISLAVSRRG